MAEKIISLSTLRALQNSGMVLVPLKKWQKIEKENRELREVTKVVLESELAIREGKIRPFKEFLAEFHAKDK
ncbi:MAG: hypothetical protein A3C50_03935 [Candidatus Staskawiczbacteria bacterium RIFCSPHIGHO2_02_FULL_43_16]|uniref:Uncharacterized protein n=1 Tax=Candidatus Staskawiczbacteria bacterium RIFCSPHIGHO2_01_FULL_41_41 TaxID=1802203 RepID=A0A1G2HS80_9BACT|nr:MAG: hypothetical protein A2822_03820 [Candidatus Staskawiczbacteria bacterium RIFCSPHIGHO2_01_FULL_41_41]OGZ68082.1 MAG: hypothetical protein A3C50_03935 [Candidatus Staskawiczbacteria bacterium RIFCSPHIGHO2_02_FULL_43_16]OGZ74820.1 MAG: hypothetical protein A3A12_03125 [Candidatus Staskawiczbacteria bacterium RIFCSPLOWO2_01_FULL_43_17b]